jgi:valyl-tRNA synthetase
VAPLAGVSGETVMLQPFPAAADFPPDEEAEREVAWLQGVILGVREIRGAMNISPARRIPLLLKGASAVDEALSVRHRLWLERLAGIDSIRVLGAGEREPPSAPAIIGTLTVLVPLAGLIDAAAEAERLGKLLAKAQGELAKARDRLANEDFVRGAPPEVVAKERERVTELERTVSALGAQLERVRRLLPP